VRSRIAAYRKTAEDAVVANDFAKAANAYRIAAHLAPDDVGLIERAAEVQKLAAAALAAGYLKQGAYEEHEGRWADASLSYVRAAEGRPDDAFAHERAAFAMIKAGSNARRAVELARRAVEIQPQSPDNHITLARAFLAASFAVSAVAELDRALAAGPLDAQHKQIVAELRDQAHRMSKLG
jgi:tetratricopeptide (TPR) repeat protein